MKYVLWILLFSSTLTYGQKKTIQQIDRIPIVHVGPELKEVLQNEIEYLKPIFIDNIPVSVCSYDLEVIYLSPWEKSASKRTYYSDEIQSMPRESDILNSTLMTVPGVFGKF
jgi:hypothetical protein